jgi:uncharacterized FAD-dependent dehydrogenase
MLYKLCIKNNIEIQNMKVDLGVRVEIPSLVWKHLTDKVYEPKISYRTKQYKDIVRTFCVNVGGEVVVENTDGIMTVNGHSNKDKSKHTENTNFSLLSTISFSEPFHNTVEYVKHIAKLSNMIACDGVIVQRFGDLINGQRTTAERLKKSTVRPTLNAVAGDLSLCIPKRQLDNIIEMIFALDKIAQGTANYDTLLYGVEAKYYSVKPKFLNDSFEILEDVYAVGDSTGVTRSLSQAGAHGLYVAEQILQTIKS